MPGSEVINPPLLKVVLLPNAALLSLCRNILKRFENLVLSIFCAPSPHYNPSITLNLRDFNLN